MTCQRSLVHIECASRMALLLAASRLRLIGLPVGPVSPTLLAATPYATASEPTSPASQQTEGEYPVKRSQQQASMSCSLQVHASVANRLGFPGMPSSILEAPPPNWRSTKKDARGQAPYKQSCPGFRNQTRK